MPAKQFVYIETVLQHYVAWSKQGEVWLWMAIKQGLSFAPLTNLYSSSTNGIQVPQFSFHHVST